MLFLGAIRPRGGLAYEMGGGGWDAHCLSQGFWSRLGRSEKKDIMCTSISSREGLVQGFTQRNIKIYI